MKRLACCKYRRLSEIADMRLLSASEELFLSSHARTCGTCAGENEQFQLAMNMLRGAELEVTPSRNFNDRLIRRIKVQQVKGSVRYWSPMFVGAALAGLVLIASLHMITASSQLPSIRFGNGNNPETKRETRSSAYPDPIFDIRPGR